MARHHGLDHVESLAAAALADDDAVGALAQRMDDELSDGDLALALDIGAACGLAHDMGLLETQLRRVLDRDDALVVRDEGGTGVEQRRLARARAAGDDDVHAAEHDGLHELEHALVEGAERHEVLGLHRVRSELSDVENVVVDGDALGRRRDARAVEDGAGSVEDAVAQRLRLVAAATVGGRDAVDDELDMLVVLEGHRGLLQQARALDPDVIRGVDHNL